MKPHEYTVCSCSHHKNQSQGEHLSRTMMIKAAHVCSLSLEAATSPPLTHKHSKSNLVPTLSGPEKVQLINERSFFLLLIERWNSSRTRIFSRFLFPVRIPTNRKFSHPSSSDRMRKLKASNRALRQNKPLQPSCTVTQP